MPNDPDKIKALYDAVSKDYDVGSYNDFSAKLQDSAKRRAFYDFASKSFDLGDYNSFENNVGVKKKELANVSPVGSSTTTKSISSPEQLVPGGTPASQAQTIKMPELKVDQTVHEDDPIHNAVQGHREEYASSLNELNNSGLSNRQVSDATATKAIPAKNTYKEVLKNKIGKATRDYNNTYDAVTSQVLPNFDAANNFLQKTAEKNNGQLPDNNETVNAAVEKINDFKEREKNILNSPDLTTAAVNEAIRQNPRLQKEIDVIKKEHPGVEDYKQLLPNAMVGRIVNDFYNDPANKDVIDHNPRLKDAFENFGKNNLTDNPEYGAVVVGNELSRARQKEGKNNPVANAIIGSSKYMDDLAQRLYKDDPQKLEIYNKIVRNNFNKYIDTKDFLSSFAEGGKGVFKGIKNTAKELTGNGSDAESMYNALKEENEQVSSGAHGIYDYTDPAGKMTGMVAAMIGTGGVLRGAGLGEKIANGANVGLTFWGDEKNKFRLKFPGDPLKQNVGATLMTAAYLAAPNAIPSNKLSKVMSGVKPELETITDDLINGTITKDAAKTKAMYAFEQALKFGKEAGKQNLKTAGENTAITAFGQGLDKSLGITDEKFKQYHPEGELQDVAKTMLIGNAVPSALLGIAGIRSRPYTKESLYEMADNPTRFKSVLNDQMLRDPESHTNIEAKLEDLDHLVRTKAELDAHTDLSTEQKKQYILQDYNEKILRQKAEGITNEFLKSKIDDQIKKAAAIKENIFKGKGTDVLPQEDHLSSKEFKEVHEIKSDKELFDHFLNKAQKGYKTTLDAAAKMEDEKAGTKAGLDYLKDKAVENPVKFREDWGDELTNKMLDRATTQEIGDSFTNLININSDDPAIPILEKILDEREAKGEVYSPKKNYKEEIEESSVIPENEKGNISHVIENNKDLLSIGTPEEYYEYLKSLFPDSKVSGKIFHHRGKSKISAFDKSKLKEGENAFYFHDNLKAEGYGKEITSAVLNLKNPSDRFPEEGVPEGTDSTIASIYKSEDEVDPTMKSLGKKLSDLVEYGAYDPKQIHILGSKEDVEGFKQWKLNKEKTNQDASSIEIPVEMGEQPIGSQSTRGSGGEGVGRSNEGKVAAGTSSEEAGKNTGKEEDLTGITHPQMDETAKEFGLETYNEDPETVKEWDDAADKRIAKNPNAIPDLLNKLRKGEQPDKVEQRMMIKYIADLKARIRTNPTDELLDQLKRAKDLSNIVGGREVAKSLRARQGSVPVEHTLADDLVEKMDTLGVEKLTDKQKEETTKLFTDEEKAQTELQKKYDELQEKHNKLLAEQEVKKMKAKSPEKMTHEQRVEQRKKSLQDARAALLKVAKGEGGAMAAIPGLPQLIAIAPHVKDYAKSLVAEGIDNLGELVKKIHSEFKDVLEGISEKDIHNILAGDYNKEKPTRSALAAKMHDLKTEAELINKLERLQAGIEPKSEKAKVERNKQIKELRDKIGAFKKEEKEAGKFYGEEFSDESKQLEAKKKRLKDQIQSVEEQISKGDFSTPEKKPELKLDKEALELQDKLIEARKKRQLAKLKDFYENQTKWQKGVRYTSEILNLPRALMSSADLSAVLRQGVIPSASHPLMSAKASKEMINSAFSQKNYDRWFYNLEKKDPRYKDMMETGLAITDSTDPNVLAREELFMSNLANKIPVAGAVIKASERAYSMYLNKMRVDLYNMFAEQMEKRGLTVKNSPKEYKAMADYINNATGRGSVHKSIEPIIPLLNSVFFSPRLIASRINMMTYLAQPRFYKSVPKEVRLAYLKDMGKFILAGTAVLALAKYGFGSDVETDPRSADFAKIKSGRTRWDVWGGFQPYVRAATQVMMGQRKSTNTGKMYELGEHKAFGATRGDVLASFFRGKLAPVPGLAVDILSGRNMVGDQYTTKLYGAKPGEKDLSDVALEHLVPMTVTGMKDAWQDQGPKSLANVLIPSMLGVGTQTYEPPKKKK